MGQLPEEVVEGLTTEELECKICYCAYNLSSRRPKVLECCHRLCSKCLAKLLNLGESPPNSVVCPFCRYVTGLPGESGGSLPDDYNLVTVLSIQNQYLNLKGSQGEILLSPGRLNSLVGYSASESPSSICSNYVVITIMESLQDSAISADHRSSSLDSMASVTRRCTVWNCTTLLCQASARILLWVLGLLYFSSLPTGVYLLIMQKTTLGVLLISLVPVSLLMIMVYGVCRCLCYEFCNCVPP
ncbi:E3 ubiquitin-protein ligase RNF182 [Ictalurus punctatus]|uniref:E3 ubiquitin-protein ligase RNF182 n=1 Tax=Ictalurus punctatus TaxID=7998 RepID=A0A2D0R8S8_ICTPU|nr:E3 ubiquitin-protein ligase RNF182 [Ictalurus punctatus]XP_053486179.1 E3 ubiquitin-protein ligase RNF182 [Ictalurus furcatus]